MKTALTIAGSDSSGGAGIQADIKTMMANGVYAMSAITALTAQNTTGVTAIQNATAEFLGQELDCIFTDIFPDAVKIGMVSESDLIHMIAGKLRQYRAKNIVVDPVMVATSGARLINEEAVDVLKEELFPLADLLTPNIPETEVLTGLQKRFPNSITVQFFAKAAISLMMPMIFSMRMEHISGLREKGSTIPIPTEQDVLFPRPSLPTLQRDFPWWNL